MKEIQIKQIENGYTIYSSYKEIFVKTKAEVVEFVEKALSTTTDWNRWSSCLVGDKKDDKMRKIPKNIIEEPKRLLKELDKLENDPEVQMECEEFARKISTLTPEQLQKRFTI